MLTHSPKKSFIDPHLLTDAEVSARIVAHDPDLKIVEGKPGEGSFYNSETKRFTLDPEHCGTRSEAIWTACHEGMHCWLTLPYSKIPLTALEKEALFSKVGFSSTNNVIEDCAGNDGMVRGFSGLTEPTIEVYREELNKAGGILALPDIMAAFQRLGREPMFAKALKSVLNSWGEFRVQRGDFNAELKAENGFKFRDTGDAEVNKILEGASTALRAAINTTTKKGTEDKATVRQISMARFHLIKDYVFPFIEELVKKDLLNEELNQAAQEGLKQGKLSEGTTKEIRDQQGKGKQDNGGPGGKPGADQNGEGNEAGQPSQGASQQGKQGKSSQGTVGGQQSSPGLGKNGGKGVAKEISHREGSEPNQSSQGDPQPGEPSQGTVGKAGDPQHQELENQGGKEIPIDVSKLSDEARKEIEEFKNSLSFKKSKEIAETAHRKLADIDDAIAEALKPKTVQNDTAPTHKERAREAAEKADSTARQKNWGSLNMGLRDAALKAATPYDRIFMEIAPKIDESEEAIRHIFIPNEDEEWRGAFSTGQRLNVRGALNFSANPSEYEHLFDRREAPTLYSYEFWVVIDRSSSMEEGGKMEATKRVAVYINELTARFKMPCSLYVFDDQLEVIKGVTDDPADRDVQKRLAESMEPQGGTNDADAIASVYKDTDQSRKKHQFILVLSDAESGAGEELKACVKKIQSDGRVILFHFGIGPDTSDLHGLYVNSKGDLNITGEGNFFDEFVNTIEEMILNPWQFKGEKDGKDI